ncbi:hypothetical protein EYF80_033317 [Liparis tanakae]|uniref:Uncharacterized protein n=1 Tax=Liparis tanakae TaxID=230148 RepID=A0A4Z2GS90_9TELE|nr:hypothetical protein EYF80_033317 [Liparis tanakae]
MRGLNASVAFPPSRGGARDPSRGILGVLLGGSTRRQNSIFINSWHRWNVPEHVRPQGASDEEGRYMSRGVLTVQNDSLTNLEKEKEAFSAGKESRCTLELYCKVNFTSKFHQGHNKKFPNCLDTFLLVTFDQTEKRLNFCTWEYIVNCGRMKADDPISEQLVKTRRPYSVSENRWLN